MRFVRWMRRDVPVNRFAYLCAMTVMVIDAYRFISEIVR